MFMTGVLYTVCGARVYIFLMFWMLQFLQGLKELGLHLKNVECAKYMHVHSKWKTNGSPHCILSNIIATSDFHRKCHPVLKVICLQNTCFEVV